MKIPRALSYGFFACLVIGSAFPIQARQEFRAPNKNTPVEKTSARAPRTTADTLHGLKNHPDLLPRIKFSVGLSKRSKLGRGIFQFGRPVVVGDTVYVGSATAQVAAISDIGKLRWRATTQGPVYGGVAVDGASVFACDAKGFVYSFRASDGREEWRTETGSELATQPLIVGKMIYVVSSRGELIAIDRAQGALLWKSPDRPSTGMFLVKGVASPQLVGNMIIAGYSNGALIAHHPANGGILWERMIAKRNAVLADVDMTPLVTGGTMYVASVQQGLSAMDLRSGTTRWTTAFGTPNDVWLAGDTLYVSSNGTVRALAAKTGHVMWERALPESETSNPVIAHGHLVVASTKKSLYLLNPSTGEIEAWRGLAGGTLGRLTVTGDRVYALTNANKLIALEFK